MTWQVFQSDILVLFSYFLANRNATILKRMKWQFQICFAMSSFLCVSEQNIGDINRFLTFIVSPFLVAMEHILQLHNQFRSCRVIARNL